MYRKRIKIDLLIHDLKVPLAVVETGISSLLQRQNNKINTGLFQKIRRKSS